MNNLISVIVPVYNVEEYVEKCVTSILLQTYQNFELILLNDGSTDHSYDKLLKFKDNPHVIIRDKQNTGQSDTRYQGLMMSQGEYVYFVDSDDYIEPNTLERLLTAAIESCADVVFGKYRLVNDRGNVLRTQNDYTVNKIEGTNDILRDALCVSNFKSSLWLKLIRKKLLVASYLDEVRDIHFNEDVCLSILIASHSKIAVFINDVVYNVLQRDCSVSRNVNPAFISANDHIFKIIRNRLCEMQLWNDMAENYYNGYAKTMLFAFALSAIKCKSYNDYHNLYKILHYSSIYYSNEFKNNESRLNKSYKVLLAISTHPRIFYMVINMMKSFLKF